jgi:hypothetical protein
MNIPYRTKSGVKIGVYYQKPKYIEEDMDMLRLQSFLIHDPDRLKRDYWVNRVLIGLSLFVCTCILLKGCFA